MRISPLVANTPSLVREAVRLAPARPNFAAGLRAALAATVPVLLVPVLHQRELVWASIAGFGTVLADKGGDYRTRAETMAAYALCGALATLVGTLAGPYALLATVLLVVVVTVCGFVRLFGPEATGVGVSVAVALVVALALPVTSQGEALERSGFFLLGCAWAAVGSLLLWPLRPFRPARLAVAASLREIARFAATLPSLRLEGEASSTRREIVGGVRASIQTARATIGTFRRGRLGTGRRGEQLLVLLEGVDALFATLIALELALSPEHEDLAGTVRATVHAAVSARAAALREIADAIADERPLHVSKTILPSGVDRRDAPPPSEAILMLQRVNDEVSDLARVAAGLDTPGATSARGTPGLDELLPTRASPWAILRSNLTFDSAVLRHALRISISTAATVVVARALHLGHGYWASVTCLVILQPHGVATFAKALQRVGGTLVGAGLAIAAATWLHDPRAILAAIFVFAALAVALLPLNYGAYAVFLTPSFVLLAEAGASGGALARVRVVNTLLGAAISLVGARLLFPLSERDHFRPTMASAIQALRELLDVAARPAGTAVALKKARSRVGLAMINAEASFQRLLTETARAPAEHEALLTLVLYAHRLAAGLIALAVGGGEEARVDLARRAPVLAAGLEDLRQAVERGVDVDPLAMPASDATEPMPRDARTARVDRIATQLEVQRAAWRRACAEHRA